MKFYTLRQNNSGGVFLGKYLYVIVRAKDSKEAADKAESNKKVGVYFCGVLAGRDCSCCGDRWSHPWDDDGEETPSIYGDAVGIEDLDRDQSGEYEGDSYYYIS